MPGARSRYFLMPPKLKALRSRFRGRAFRMLDVGAGNHSASLTKSFFPLCRYEGLDRNRDYNNDPVDFDRMDAFHEVDLDHGSLDGLEDRAYDAIVMAHVIEHLQRGEAVLRELTKKLAPGGILYVEFPSPRSLHLPSMPGSLNFHDDPTHVRPYTGEEVAGILRDCGLRVMRSGRRRDWQLLLLTPLTVVRAWRVHGVVPGGVVWDLFGFADYAMAERPA